LRKKDDFREHISSFLFEIPVLLMGSLSSFYFLIKEYGPQWGLYNDNREITILGLIVFLVVSLASFSFSAIVNLRRKSKSKRELEILVDDLKIMEERANCYGNSIEEVQKRLLYSICTKSASGLEYDIRKIIETCFSALTAMDDKDFSISIAYGYDFESEWIYPNSNDKENLKKMLDDEDSICTKVIKGATTSPYIKDKTSAMKENGYLPNSAKEKQSAIGNLPGIIVYHRLLHNKWDINARAVFSISTYKKIDYTFAKDNVEEYIEKFESILETFLVVGYLRLSSFKAG